MKFAEFVFSTFLRYPIRRIWSINGSKQFLGTQNSSNLTLESISRHICQRSSFSPNFDKIHKITLFLEGRGVLRDEFLRTWKFFSRKVRYLRIIFHIIISRPHIFKSQGSTTILRFFSQKKTPLFEPITYTTKL